MLPPPPLFPSQKIRISRAFSLVEILVVIAVVGVLAAIAINTLTGIAEKSRRTITNQNAATIANLFVGARAAGDTFAGYDKNKVIDALTTAPGLRGHGKMDGITFYVSMSPAEVAAVKASTSLVGEGVGSDFKLLYMGPSN